MCWSDIVLYHLSPLLCRQCYVCWSDIVLYRLFYVDNGTCVGVISSFITSCRQWHVCWSDIVLYHLFYVDNGTCVGVISSFIASFTSTMTRVLEWYRPLSPLLRRIWYACWSDIVLYHLFYVDYSMRVGVILSFIASLWSIWHDQ